MAFLFGILDLKLRAWLPEQHGPLTTLGLGVVAVSAPFSWTIEFSQPYSGLFRIPANRLIETIDAVRT